MLKYFDNVKVEDGKTFADHTLILVRKTNVNCHVVPFQSSDYMLHTLGSVIQELS